jgi:hypothetical protein
MKYALSGYQIRTGEKKIQKIINNSRQEGTQCMNSRLSPANCNIITLAIAVYSA